MRGAAVYTLVFVTALLGACNTAAPIYCTPDETMCHGSCAALYKDAENCGGCDIACGPGFVCSEGACATSCGGGTTQCGQSCVETLVDRDNCGGCGQACAAGEVCSHGSCGTTCAIDQKFCQATQPYCADVASDNLNCGDCGVRCGVKEICTSGKCVTACEQGETLCNSVCADLKTSAEYCGSCTRSCDPTQYCIDGACACINGLATCNGKCVDLGIDKNNCGACGQTCTSGTCNGGRCALVVGEGAETDALAEDATHLFFSLPAIGQIRQAAKTNLASTAIATNSLTSSLATDTSYIYWPKGTAIEIALIGGNGTTELALTNSATEVTTDGTWVFVADALGIRRFPSGGGTVADVVSDGTPHALAASNGLIFWANDSYELERANADGSSRSTLATMSSEIDAVVTDGVSLYFTWSSDILSLPIQGSGPPLALATGLQGIASLATDGVSVYWADATSISKVPVGGGAVTQLYASNGVARVVVDATSVYWTSSFQEIGKLTPK